MGYPGKLEVGVWKLDGGARPVLWKPKGFRYRPPAMAGLKPSNYGEVEKAQEVSGHVGTL